MVKDKIILDGMVFFGHHGAKAAEKELGQRFTIDVIMSVDLVPAGTADDLKATVHYGHVYRLVRKIAEGPAFNLIESLAESIAREILAAFPPVREVTVRVKKPEAPIQGVLAFAAVEIVRGR
jgi:dihydroneopterin aldolase